MIKVQAIPKLSCDHSIHLIGLQVLFPPKANLAPKSVGDKKNRLITTKSNSDMTDLQIQKYYQDRWHIYHLQKISPFPLTTSNYKLVSLFWEWINICQYVNIWRNSGSTLILAHNLLWRRRNLEELISTLFMGFISQMRKVRKIRIVKGLSYQKILFDML